MSLEHNSLPKFPWGLHSHTQPKAQSCPLVTAADETAVYYFQCYPCYRIFNICFFPLKARTWTSKQIPPSMKLPLWAVKRRHRKENNVPASSLRHCVVGHTAEECPFLNARNHLHSAVHHSLFAQGQRAGARYGSSNGFAKTAVGYVILIYTHT